MLTPPPPKAAQCLKVSRYIVREEFQRDKAVQARVFGLIHNTHAATAELLDDAIVGNCASEGGREISHIAGILRLLPDNCR
jgi:hypothetical protein